MQPLERRFVSVQLREMRPLSLLVRQADRMTVKGQLRFSEVDHAVELMAISSINIERILWRNLERLV